VETSTLSVKYFLCVKTICFKASAEKRRCNKRLDFTIIACRIGAQSWRSQSFERLTQWRQQWWLIDSINVFDYRQACAKRSHVGIVFTQWSKNRFFAPINVKFGTGERITIIGAEMWEPPKLSEFRIFAINLPLRGNWFAVFPRNYQRLYASIGSY